MPQSHVCLKCSVVFPTRQQLRRHEQRKRPCDSKTNTCTLCDTGFSNRKNYLYHVENAVCVKNSDKIVKKIIAEHEKHPKDDLEEILTDGSMQEKKLEEIKLERARLDLMKMETALKLSEQSRINININNTNNINNTVILSLGNDNLGCLNLTTIFRKTVNLPTRGAYGEGQCFKNAV